jgi:hypothetical protein
MSIEAMKQALEALENHTAIKHPQQMHYWESAVDALRQAIEQAKMVKKGTKAWANTPDNWVDDLRGGAEAMKQAVAWAKFNQGEITHSEMTDGSGCDFDLKAAGFVPLYTAPPKREWVGLKDEDLPEGETYDFDRGVRWAERYLKEKNYEH